MANSAGASVLSAVLLATTAMASPSVLMQPASATEEVRSDAPQTVRLLNRCMHSRLDVSIRLLSFQDGPHMFVSQATMSPEERRHAAVERRKELLSQA